MKFRFVLLFLSLFLFQTFAVAANLSEPKSITIGLIPGGNPEKLKSQALVLATNLGKKMGLPVNVYVSKNYRGLIEAMKENKVDFAFFSSSTFVEAEKIAGAKVLLKTVWSQPFYYSALVTPKKSKIRSMKDLKGSRIAFVDKSSSSGFLYPKVELQKRGLKESDFKEVVFSGNHSESVKLLENNKVDIAAVFSDDEKGISSAWSASPQGASGYRILWLSPPIPNDPFCVRQGFYDQYPKITHNLMFSLIELVEESGDGKPYAEILGSHNLIPATSRQYDPVREMVKALNLAP